RLQPETSGSGLGRRIHSQRMEQPLCFKNRQTASDELLFFVPPRPGLNSVLNSYPPFRHLRVLSRAQAPPEVG
ncbi:MAG TPA: hypothetical protein VLN58_10225, partial [Verrucomicrobiae bacterium]|nr:hypothetical protein [Verrucomicrobiae bacterium]